MVINNFRIKFFFIVLKTYLANAVNNSIVFVKSLTTIPGRYIIFHKGSIVRNSSAKEYIVNHDKRLIYCSISKVACTSIKFTFLDENISDEYSTHEALRKKEGIDIRFDELRNDEKKAYYKFTFIRNPYERLVSCYESKYHYDNYRLEVIKQRHYDTYMSGILKKDNGFIGFSEMVSKIPDCLSDRHFVSQYHIIYDKGRCNVDFIGRYENLLMDFDLIRDKYNLNEIPHYNKSKDYDWREYYSERIAIKVYNRYKKDFDLWYPEARENLLEYLRNRDKEFFTVNQNKEIDRLKLH